MFFSNESGTGKEFCLKGLEFVTESGERFRTTSKRGKKSRSNRDRDQNESRNHGRC